MKTIFKVSDNITPAKCSAMLNKVIEVCKDTSVKFTPQPYDISKLGDMCEEVTLGYFEYPNSKILGEVLSVAEFYFMENFGWSFCPAKGDNIHTVQKNDTLYLVDDMAFFELMDTLEKSGLISANH